MELLAGIQSGLPDTSWVFLGMANLMVKKLIGTGLLVCIATGVTVVCCFSQPARDAAFFMMASLMVVTERMDINYLSQEWYRGTTRGIELSLLDALAVGLLLSSLFIPRYRTRMLWPASLGLMILFLLYEIFSTAISTPKLFGVFEISKTLRAILFFLAAANYVRTERELRILVLALVCALCLQGALALKHRLILRVERVTGTFNHSNSLSMYLCMVAPLMVAAANAAWQSWVRYAAMVALGAAAVTILLTVSRAGIPIFALVVLGSVVICVSWRITLQKMLITTVAVVGLGVLVGASWNSLSARFLESSLKDELDEKQFENRGQYVGLVKEMIKGHPLGVGLNNWSFWVSKLYGPRTGVYYNDYDNIPKALLKTSKIVDIGPNYAPPAHNLAVITLGELGLPGLTLFALLWLRWFTMGVRFLWPRLADPMHRLGVGIFFGICGIFLQSLTEWVYRETSILLTFHMLLGALASLCWARRQAKRTQPTPETVTQKPRPLPVSARLQRG